MYRKDMEAPPRQVAVSAPEIPGVPKIPGLIDPKSFPEVYRDLRLNELE
jgi:hypothetical protein